MNTTNDTPIYDQVFSAAIDQVFETGNDEFLQDLEDMDLRTKPVTWA